jgi:hypothetical protein
MVTKKPMSGGGAYRQDLPAQDAAVELRRLANLVEQDGIADLSVSMRFAGVTESVEYFGAGLAPQGGAGHTPAYLGGYAS